MSSLQSPVSSLNPKPGSSTARQHQTLVMAGRRQGFELAEIRKTVGGSIRRLSAAECSEWIKHFSGNGLPNPPGQKPAPFTGNRKRTDAVRAIDPEHEEQIRRLLGEYFNDKAAGLAWLEKNFDAKRPQDLLTAARAADVIRVLKEMLARRAK